MPATLITALIPGIGPLGLAFVQLGAGLLASTISGKLAAQRAAEAAGGEGIRSAFRSSGGVAPQTLILGRFATRGHVVAPFYAHGSSGRLQNAYRTQIIDLANHPITAVTAVWINKRRCIIPGQMDGPVSGDYGISPDPVDRPLYAGKFWLRTYTGEQTAADPMLVAKYSGLGVRPWAATAVGRGIAYAVATALADDEVWAAEPDLMFEVEGSPVYDWRLDSTAGGAGSQRWADPTTWAYSANPVVLMYNVLRGIPLRSGRLYGYGVAAEDLPLAHWTTAANRCDDTVDGAPRYQAGYEIRMATPRTGGDEPATVLEVFAEACNADLVNDGGVWTVVVDGPGLPVAHLTDADFLEHGDASFDPTPPVTERYNAITATRLDPAQGWAAVPLPTRKDTAAIAQDGEERWADIALRGVSSDNQGQRLTKAWLKDARRLRRHEGTVRAAYDHLKVTDAVTWTSARWGYTAKVFVIQGIGSDAETLEPTLSLRERDPGDVGWTPGEALPTAAATDEIVVWPPEALPGLTVTAVSIKDADGGPRKPALRIAWSGTAGHDRIAFEVRVQGTGDDVSQGTTGDVEGGRLTLSDGILPSTTYEVRVRGLKPKGAWSAWIAVLTDALRLKPDDLEPGAVGPRELLVRDLSNLVANPGAEGARGWLGVGANGWAFSTAQAKSGLRSLARTYTGAASTSACENELRFEVDPGDVFRLRGLIRTGAGYVGGQAGLRVVWRDASQAWLSDSDVVVTPTGAWADVAGRVVAPANAAYAALATVVYSQTAGTIHWDNCSLRRRIAADLVEPASLKADQLAERQIGPREMTFRDLSNLVENPSAEIDTGWPGIGANGWAYSTAQARRGTRSVARTYAGAASSIGLQNALGVECTEGDVFRVEGFVMAGAGYAGGQAGVRIVWRTAADVFVAASDFMLTPSGTWAEAVGNVAAPATAALAYASWIVYSQTAGTVHFDDIKLRRRDAGKLLHTEGVVRDAVKVGAATDFTVIGDAAQGPLTTSLVEKLDVTLTQSADANLNAVAFAALVRAPAPGNDVTVDVRRRTRWVNGGVWGPWTTAGTWTVTSTDWTLVEGAETASMAGYQMQYQIRARVTTSSGVDAYQSSAFKRVEARR